MITVQMDVYCLCSILTIDIVISLFALLIRLLRAYLAYIIELIFLADY
jgi:hypothetical protein